MKDLLVFVAHIAACGGSSAAIAYMIFKSLGKQTIDAWFTKRLRMFEHDLNCIFSRVSKIHEMEFQVLPEAWRRLDNLLDSIREFIRETNHIPELDAMAPDRLDEFLTRQNLTEDGRQNIRRASSKSGRWFFEMSERAGNACLEFQDYISKNAIFLSSDLKDEFKKAEETARTAWAVRTTAQDTEGHGEDLAEVYRIMNESLPPIMEQIERLVQKRLRFFEA